MNNRLMRAAMIIACLILTVVLVSCGSSSSGASYAFATPFPPPLSQAKAQQQLSFELVLPSVLPPQATLLGVSIRHDPPISTETKSTPPADADWATAYYKNSKGRVGNWFYVFTIKESTTAIGPPVARPAASSIAVGSTPTAPTPTPQVVAKMGTPGAMTVDGVQVSRMVTSMSGLGSSGKQTGKMTDYQWQRHGINFDLTRYGNQFSDSTAEKIIDSMIK